MSQVIQVDVANNLVSIILGVLLILGTFVGMIAWFIRLESEVKYLKESHSETKVALWEKFETVQTTMNQVLITLGELKGKNSY